MHENLALRLVEEYLRIQNYTPIRIDPRKVPFGRKSPDFDVKKNNQTSFYCEVKTPELKLDPKMNMYLWNTTISKLRDMVHKAVKQFNDYDPGHSKPWVVMFTSDNFQLQWKLFADNILGVITGGQQVIKDLTAQDFIIRTQQDIKKTDLFVWLQVSPKDNKIYQRAYYINGDSKFYDDAQRIRFELLPRDEETKLLFEFKSKN